MFITSVHTAAAAGRSRTLDGESSREYGLVDPEHERASGRIDVLHLAAGAEHEVGLTGVEAALVVLAGSGNVSDPGAPLARGTLVQTSGSGPVAVQAGPDGLQLLRVAGPAAGSSAAADGAPAVVRVATVEEIVDHPFHLPEQGFLHMSARWLVDRDNGGSTTFTLGQSTFAAEVGAHELHRHPAAQELFYVLEGEGVHLAEGGEHPLSPGDLVLIDRDEWHGVRNKGASPLRAVFGYLGVDSLEAGGYELR